MNLKEYEELILKLINIKKYSYNVAGVICTSEDDNSPILDKEKTKVVSLSNEAIETIEKLYNFSQQFKESK